MTIPIVYHGLGIRWSEWRVGRHMALMEAIAEHHPVVILDAPDLAGGWRRRRRPWVERIHSRLTVVRNAFGWRAAKVGKRLLPLSAYVDANWVRTTLRSLGVREYVLWLGSPAPDRARWLDTSRLVYDCLDPCFNPRFQADFDRHERELAQRSRLVFASAEALVERMAGFGANVLHLPNGTDRVFEVTGEPPALPAELRGRPRPIIGYMGGLDFRFDFAAIEAAACQHSTMTFCLVGRLNRDQSEHVHRLRALPNVILTGPAKGERAVAFNHAFDVGVIPFRREPVNDALDPVKLYMYFLSGKPVVAASTRECRRRADLLHLASSTEEWSRAITKAASETDPEVVAKRISYATSNDWRHRAEQALQAMESQGLLALGRNGSREGETSIPRRAERAEAVRSS